MDIILGLIQNVLEEGFIYGIMAVGVFIYKYYMQRKTKGANQDQQIPITQRKTARRDRHQK